MSALHLPSELWLRIAQSLCFHCTRDPRDTHTLPDLRPDLHHRKDDMSLDSLAKLCRVSRMINTLATPVLYHAPITNNSMLLLRSLVECPSLAAHVRELDCTMWQGWPILKEKYPQWFMELYERKISHLQERGEDVFATADNWRGNGLPDTKRVNHHVRDTIVAELLPNLTAIQLESKYGYLCIGMAPGSLPNVKSAAIRHGGSGHDVSIRRYLPLFRAAPNITSMHYYGNAPDCAIEEKDDGGSRVPLQLPGIITLELENCCLVRENVPILVASHPGLETFSFRDSGKWRYFGSTVCDIQDALVTYTPGLRRLNIDMSLAEYDEWLPPSRCGFNASLAKLERLVYLAFDATCLEPGEGQDPFEYLLAILPASLEYIRISVPDERPVWLPGALTSLAGIAKEKLPALKKVVIWDHVFVNDLGEPQRPTQYVELLEAWDGANVEFVTDGFDGNSKRQGYRSY